MAYIWINVIEDDTFTREHVSTQGTLEREHVSTQGRLAREHARQTPLREKSPYSEFFSPYFPEFGLNTERYSKRNRKTQIRAFFTQWISYLILHVVVMVCKKTSKPNETRIFAKSIQGRWTIFLYSELEQALFIFKICLLEIPQISLFIWILSSLWKTLPFFFSRFNPFHITGFFLWPLKTSEN